MKTFAPGQKFILEDAFSGGLSGVMLEAVVRDGRQMIRGWYGSGVEVADHPGVPVVKVHETFTIDGVYVYVSGYDDEEGTPMLAHLPRSMYG
jgi:hypothetical protein